MIDCKQAKRLIDGCLKANQGAWESLLDKFSGIVIWSIRQRLNVSGYLFSEQDVEDLYQEVFVSLYKNNKLSQLKDPSRLACWLSILAGNIAVNYARDQKWRMREKSVPLSSDITGQKDGSLTIADILETNQPGADCQIDKEITEAALARAIESLNSKEKLILNLYLGYENGLKEIAQFLRMPQGTVASILARAKKKIRRKMFL